MVTPIATATNTAGPPINVGSDPRRIAITPDGKTAYVAAYRSDTVTPIATATNTAGPPINVGSNPGAIAITPDGRTAYVLNSDDGGPGTVTPIATATNTAGPPITTGNGPYYIAITPATVIRAPAFASSSAATAAYGARFSFTVTTTGSPHPGSPGPAGCPRAYGLRTTGTARPRSPGNPGRELPGCTR